MIIEKINSKKHIIFSFALVFCIFCTQNVNGQRIELDSYTVGEGINFSGDKNYHMEISGYVQPSFEIKIYTDDNSEGFNNRFRLRRLNLRFAGDAARQKIEYRLQIDLSGTSESGDATQGFLMDAWLAYNVNRKIQITFGQKSTPTDNRELMLGSQSLQIVERSRLTTAFSTIREFGIFMDGSFKTGSSQYLRPYLTVTNGDGINVFSKDHGGIKLGGRIDFLPFGLFSNLGQFREADVMRELTPKLVIGGNYSYNFGVSSRNGKESGSILYLNSANEELLPDFIKYGVDFMFKYKGYSAIGEFVGTSARVPKDISQRVRTDGTLSTNFDVNGVQDVENYVKERMILGKGFNLQMGYIFKNRISVDGRFTCLDADKHSFLNNGTFYNRPRYYTLGVSKYFTRGYGFKVQGSITYVDVAPGSNNNLGNPITGKEWIMNVLTSIAF